MRSPDSLATVLLSSRLAVDGVTPLKASEFWRVVARVGAPGVLLGCAADALARDHGFAADDAARVTALFDRATAVAFALDELEQSGIATLTPYDDAYPARLAARLAAQAPPVLQAVGNVALFRDTGLGVVGNHEVSPDGAAVARAAGELAARLGVPVVSGRAPGVDTLAMDAACAAGGAAVGFLADPLLRTVARPDVRRAIHAGTTLLCTPYGPDTPHSTATARGRNKLIYAQASLTFVVASDLDEGGTWDGAVEALAGGFGAVAVWRGDGAGHGNAPLEPHGATPVTSLDQLAELVTPEQ